MQKLTRQQYNQFLKDQAQLNGVESAAEKFAIEPSVQQRLETKIQESSELLKRINIVPVTEMEGEKLYIGVTGPTASRTNTQNKDRQTRDVKAMDGTKYRCEKTNYDTHTRYQTMDMWAKFKDFQPRLSRSIYERCALDRIMVGWNGTHVAEDTDLAANPKLQDVNIGWLQQLRNTAPERVLHEVVQGSGKIKVGPSAGNDYKTLDGLVYDAYKTLMDPWHAEAADLVAITGRDLMHDKLFPLVDGQKAPTEILAASIVVSQARLGRLAANAVPFFLPNAILITSWSNLSIYYQEGGRRRSILDNPKRDRVETYESSNDAFVIEDLGKAVLIENIEIEPEA